MQGQPTPTSGSGGVKPFEEGQGYFQPGEGWKSFEDWFGKKDYRMFLNNLCNQIIATMKHAEKRQKEVAEELKKSQTGDG